MGPGFESPEVHQRTKSAFITRGSSEDNPKFTPDGKVGIESEQKDTIPNESVFLTQWVHPFPFRTRKLSAAVVKILGWRRPGKIAHRRHIKGN